MRGSKVDLTLLPPGQAVGVGLLAAARDILTIKEAVLIVWTDNLSSALFASKRCTTSSAAGCCHSLRCLDGTPNFSCGSGSQSGLPETLCLMCST